MTRARGAAGPWPCQLSPMKPAAPLALTMGDPAGIGGEITLAAWARLRAAGPAFVVLDDPRRLADLAAGLGWDVPIAEVSGPEEAAAVFAERLPVMTLRLPVPAVPGRPDPANAPAVLGAIERAVALAQSGRAGGVVTNPISKATLYRSGFAFPGHTEFLGALTGTAEPPVMLLASPMLRVVPVTIHVSLRRALDTLSTAEIVRTGTGAGGRAPGRLRHRRPRASRSRASTPMPGRRARWATRRGALVVPAIEALRARGVDAFGPAAAGHDVHRPRPGRLRRRALPLPRPGAHPDQDARHGRRGERHARPAHRPHLARPRHRLRHRRPGRGRSRQPGRRPTPRGRDGRAAATRSPPRHDPHPARRERRPRRHPAERPRRHAPGPAGGRAPRPCPRRRQHHHPPPRGPPPHPGRRLPGDAGRAGGRRSTSRWRRRRRCRPSPSRFGPMPAASCPSAGRR